MHLDLDVTAADSANKDEIKYFFSIYQKLVLN